MAQLTVHSSIQRIRMEGARTSSEFGGEESVHGVSTTRGKPEVEAPAKLRQYPEREPRAAAPKPSARLLTPHGRSASPRADISDIFYSENIR